ncbi:unnamed protein product, partial [Aphanomyces euteiches]
MGEYTVALTTLDVIDLEAGLATEYPNQTLTTSILRTITRMFSLYLAPMSTSTERIHIFAVCRRNASRFVQLLRCAPRLVSNHGETASFLEWFLRFGPSIVVFELFRDQQLHCAICLESVIVMRILVHLVLAASAAVAFNQSPQDSSVKLTTEQAPVNRALQNHRVLEGKA